MDEQNGTPTRVEQPAWTQAFLKTFARSANVSLSCRAAKIGRTTAYALRNACPEFAEAWEAAWEEARDVLEKEAWRRAVSGFKRRKQIYKGGEKVSEEIVTDYSDTLLTFLLKGERPAKYREQVKHEHSGDGGGPVPIKVVEIIRSGGATNG